MKIGLSRPHGDPGYPVDDIDMGFVAQVAERTGFDWISYGHHTVRPYDEPRTGPHREGPPFYQDPLIGAARATALTTKLEVATGVLLMPLLHPVNVAKQVAGIDLYSGGRFILGLGVGGASRLENVASGGQWTDRWGYTMECVEVMKGLWTQDRFEFKGKYFDIPPVLMAPRPARKPHPPVWLGGSSEAVLRRIGESCEGWLPVCSQHKPTSDAPLSGPERMREGRAKIEAFARSAGRDAARFEIGTILFGQFDRDDLKRYEDAGVDRVAIALPSVATPEAAQDAIEAVASRALS